MAKIIPSDEQLQWLTTANTTYLVAQDEAFSNLENVRSALMDAWAAIEMLVDTDTFRELVAE